MRPRTLLPALALLAVTACAAPGPGAAPAPPSATALAGRLHCRQVIPETPPPAVRQDVTCIVSSSTQVEIATFGTARAETAWIDAGGTPQFPDPAYAGCCIQGRLWAATVASPDYDVAPVIRVIGGRAVTG